MVPEGWQHSNLGDVTEFQRGFDLPKSQREVGDIPIISSGGHSGQHSVAKVERPGIVTGRYGSIGEVFFVEGHHWPLNTTLWVKDFHDNDLHWAYYLLQTIDYAKFSDKTGVPGINRNDIHRIKVGVPPLPEQRKIADILSTWDRAIERTDALLANARTQKRALMQSLLTGKRRFPEFEGQPWKDVRLGNVTKKIGSGVTPKGGRDSYLSEGIPLIRSQNVGWGHLIMDDVAFISDDQHHSMSGSKLKNSDVLLNITGASIGRSSVFLGQDNTANVNQHVCIVRAGEVADPAFISAFLLSFYGQKQIAQFQAGGNRQGLNFEQIGSFRLPLPDIAEQQMIAKAIGIADNGIDLLVQNIEKLRNEKKALMQQLLTGKRRVMI